MASRIRCEVPLPPSEVLDKLHAEPVSFDIFRQMLSTPGKSYAELLHAGHHRPQATDVEN